jgi:uncharacterized protein (DUF2141 family)
MNRLLGIFGVLLLFSCAQQVAPTGGPKDETPPKILEEIPPNLSTNFASNEIEIAFDEFIQLRSTSEQVVISPPIAKQPAYQLKKKSLIVKFEEPLAPNTTYTINFGEAIRDNNEGNILDNYTYVFSTGAHLDSMEVKGKVTDVLTGEPEPEALIMLYKNDVDSLPLDTLPDYFTRSDNSGSFHIQNIANQKYKIFALKDENANYKFDLKTEKIGFLDTLITPFAEIKPAPIDTAAADSTVADTVSTNAVKPQEQPVVPSYEMKMFVEEDTTQFLKKSYCDYYGKLVFIYNLPVESFQVEMLNSSMKKQWTLVDIHPTQDTVTVWVTDVAPEEMNLLTIADELVDTVQMTMKERTETLAVQGKGKGANRGQVKFALSAKTHPATGRSPKPKEPLTVIWNHPILGMDISKMKLYEDSLRVQYDISTEDRALRKFDVAYDWKPGKSYKLVILDSAFNDIYNLWNDTVETEFKGTDKDMFGTITLKVGEAPKAPALAELVSSSGQFIARKVIPDQGKVEFKQLEPGKYELISIEDLNNNGLWDTGNYLEKLQPEPIRTIKKSAEVRANWDLELEWNPND